MHLPAGRQRTPDLSGNYDVLSHESGLSGKSEVCDRLAIDLRLIHDQFRGKMAMAEGYNITPENLVYHTLIGLEVVVSGSANPDMVGITGVVIDETRNTLVISPSLTGVFHGKPNRKIDIDSDGDRGDRGVLPELPLSPATLSGKDDRIVPKSHTTFIFELPGSDRVRVNGGLLVARPEDRIAKKHKKPGRI